MKALVVYDTTYGNTGQVAKAIADGMRKQKIETDLISLRDQKDIDVQGYGAVILGCPTHAMSATLRAKKFFKGMKKSKATDKPVAFFDTRFKGVNKGGVNVLETLASKSGNPVLINGLIILVGGMKGPLESEAIPKSTKFGEIVASKLRK